MWQVKAQIAPPVSSQTIASGNQNLLSQTTTGTEKWYNFQNTTADVHVIVDIMQQGLQYKCNELKFYIKTAGSLYLISKDSLYTGESKLEVFAPNKAIGSDLYVQVINKTFTCTTCTPANPIFNLSIVNRLPGCGGYIQPTCEYVKDGGFEYFNAPCSTIDILQSYTTDLDAQFAPCFWTLPGPLTVSNITRGTPDYFTACAATTPSSLSTNAYSNAFNNPFSTTTHSGDSYAGLLCFAPPASGPYREYISQQLATNLTAGSVYKISMYVRLSRSSKRATDDIQALLSTVTPTQTLDVFINPPTVPGGTQLISMSTTTITDVVNWTYLTTTFTATGNYSNLTLGNFQDDATISLQNVSSTSYFPFGGVSGTSYYFIDDVSIVLKPTFSVTPVTATYCPSSPSTVTLSIITPTLGATYSWTSSIGTVSTGTSIVVSPTTSINYTVTSSLGGCLNTAYTSITLVPPYPIPALIATPTVVCPGGVFDIIVNPAAAGGGIFTSYNYVVMPSSTFGSGAGIYSIPTYTTGVNIYTVTINDPSGICPITQTISIYVQPYPSYTIAPNPLCPGATATLSSSGIYIQPLGLFTTGMFVDWGDTYSENVLDSTKTHIYTTPGTYTLNITGENYLHCSNTSSLVLLVTSSTPTLIASPNQSICPGATRTLTASGATSYTWQPGGVVSNSIVVTPSVTTIYTVTGTGVCGGTAIKTITVTVLPKPTISITSTLSNLCSAASSGSTTVLSYATSPSGTSATWVATNATSGAILPVPITGGASTATVNLTSYINYTSNINFVATYTSSGGCIGTQTITLYACCTPTAGVTKYTNTTFPSGVIISTGSAIFSGTITVNAGNLTLLNTNVYLDPNTKIILNGTSNFLPQNTYMHGCNAMWDGIYAMGTANQIGLTGCRIEDAKRAIVDSLGIAKLNVINSYFNKNQIGIVIKGTKPSPATVIIRNNLFTCSTISVTPVTWNPLPATLSNSTAIGAFPSTTMLPPYNMYNSYCGVYLYNAKLTGTTNSVIPIGNGSTEVNIFDKMKAGIVNYQSNMNVQKNLFQNITSAMNNPGELTLTDGGAIQVVAFFGAGPYYSNIGSTVANKNVFYNNEYGVYNYGKSVINMLYNRLENQTNGVYIYANATNSVVNIALNKFINNTLGVNCYQNNPSKITVQNNWFDNTVSCGNTASNFAIRFTENVLVTTPASFPKYDAFNNYINGYYNGIKAAQTFSTQIRDNEVHMRQDLGAWNFQFGIHTVGGNNNSVYNNIVDVPTPTSYWWQAGIFTDNSVVPKVHCNTVSNICYGLAVNSICYTTAGDGFYGNTMKNNYQGFTLGAAGEIGDQYKPGLVSADNAWIGCTNETSSGPGCNTIGAKFYTRSITPYSILTPTNSGTGILLTGTNISAASTGSCYAGISTPTLGLRLGGASGMALLMNNANNIANGATGIDGNIKHIARKQLYTHLSLMQIDESVTPAINAFANSYRHLPLGKLFMVDSLINTGDSAKLLMANTLNSSIRTSELVDATQQQFNVLYINYLNTKSKPSENLIASLESIALLCPTTNGSAVHQARTVLFNHTKKQYYNTCEFSPLKTDSKKLEKPSLGYILPDISIYPNPANTVVYINAKDYEYITLKLYNVMGELIAEQLMDNTNIGLDVSKLSNGIYVYKAYYNGTEQKTGKLIITK